MDSLLDTVTKLHRHSPKFVDIIYLRYRSISTAPPQKVGLIGAGECYMPRRIFMGSVKRPAGYSDCSASGQHGDIELLTHTDHSLGAASANFSPSGIILGKLLLKMVKNSRTRSVRVLFRVQTLARGIVFRPSTPHQIIKPTK